MIDGSNFKSPWYEMARITLLPLSQNQKDLKVAIKEWHWDGSEVDLKPDDSDPDYIYSKYGEEEKEDYHVQCELCFHPGLRYVYKIVNRFTRSELLVGSECIKVFTELQGGNKNQANKQVRNAKKERINRSNFDHVVLCLQKLNNKNKAQDLIKYYDERSFFTPKQVEMIFGMFYYEDISYRPAAFKMSIKKNKEKDQLLKEIAPWKVENILWPCMSPSQQKWYEKNKKIRLYRGN